MIFVKYYIYLYIILYKYCIKYESAIIIALVMIKVCKTDYRKMIREGKGTILVSQGISRMRFKLKSFRGN